MGKYKVINRFKEKNHDDHVYKVGDVYPAEGKKLVKTRADFLTKPHATYGVAFLEELEPPTPPKKAQATTAKKQGATDQEQTSDDK